MTAPIRIVIADDEPPALATLRELVLARDCVELCAACSDGADAVDAIRRLRPDLVFLDVQLPDLDGFSVLGELAPDPAPEVVFVTAYDEFAVRAFEVHAIDYLVKPFTDARFELAFARARARVRGGARSGPGGAARVLHELGAGTGEAIAPPGHFLVRTGRRSVLIGVDEVDWIEADGYYATLHVRGEAHLVRETMASLEARLDPVRFARIHRSAIVNLGRVRELRRTAAGHLEAVLTDGTKLEVSRSRRRAFARSVSARR
jgi:two-component system LytT family response regulator